MEGDSLKNIGGDPDALANEYRKLGWHVIRLGEGIVTKQDFFMAAKSVFPLDPPVHGDDNWDALSDSIWGGLDELEAERIVIVWPGPAGNSEDMEIARAVLQDICASLSNPQLTAGNPKTVKVIITGLASGRE